MSDTGHHHMTDDAHDERVRFTPTNAMGSVLERFERTGLGDLDGEWASVRFDDGETIAVRAADLVPVTWESGEYVYVPDDDSEYGPVWLTSEALENFTTDELAEATSAELIISLDGWRGHYLAADWLSVAADLLGEVPGDDPHTHVDRMAKLAELEREAREAAERYHAHNDIPPTSDETCGEDCICEFIHDIANDVESMIGDAGYVTIWNDGVQTFKVS